MISTVERKPGATNVANREGLFGEILVSRGLLTESQLQECRALTASWRMRIGEVAIAKGYVREWDVAHALAEHLGMPFADLRAEPPDRALLQGAQPIDFLRLAAIPWRREQDGVVRYATYDPQLAARKLTERLPAGDWRLAMATRRDFSLALKVAFKSEILREATEGLHFREPLMSAKRVLDGGQQTLLLAVLSCLCVAIAVWPHAMLASLHTLGSVFMLISLLFKVVLFTISARHIEFESVVTDEEARAIPDGELPTFTVLVPLYKEAEVLPILANALRNLEYPLPKLDIKLIFEEDDQATIDVARSLGLEGIFEFIIVPPSLPRTKPKACNFALQLARGEYCVIFDAEDKPEPLQLRKVVVAFRKSGPDVGCIQARLNYYNAGENNLTKLFALDYAAWFDYCLPALDYLRMPIPLGGTSNHFRTELLRELGAWDPYNVTEDADLGIRIAQKGYRVAIVNSTTWEEAVSRIRPWIRQRSRWMKGFTQTWLVHMRSPGRLLRQTGWRGFLAFQVLIGGTVLTALLNPLLLLIFFTWLITGWHPIPEAGQGVLLAFGTISLFLGNCFFIYMGILAPLKRIELRDLALWGLLTPAYWLLAAYACWRGIGQLVTEPHFWEKTPHGISITTARELEATVR